MKFSNKVEAEDAYSVAFEGGYVEYLERDFFF